MILFLNFAPYQFGGGVERWMLDVANTLQAKEEVHLIEVDRKIADIYGQTVLKRKFDIRLAAKVLKNLRLDNITLGSLLPFSKKWSKIRKDLLAARKIYTKFEVNELLILLYFGGAGIFRKTIVGTHSPLVYDHKNKTFFEKLHNYIYLSKFSSWLLKKFLIIHVLTDQQENILKNDLALSNVIKIPNYVLSAPKINNYKNNHQLNIGFVGELTWRKGIDILAEVIKNSPSYYHYFILGDGPGRTLITQIKNSAVHYFGYKSHNSVMEMLERLDVLLLPSRAESFSLVSLEAMSLGTTVLSSSFSTPNILQDVVISNKSNSSKEYLEKLANIYSLKKTGKLRDQRSLLKKTINKYFSKEVIMEQLNNKLFN